MNAVSIVSEKQRFLGNILTGVGHIALGTAVAFAVNKLAHQLFDINEKSDADYATRAVAFAAGIAASICLAPLTPIYSMTSGEVGQFLGTAGAIVVISGFFNEELGLQIWFAVGTMSVGPIIGLGGRVALFSLVAIGAAIGANL